MTFTFPLVPLPEAPSTRPFDTCARDMANAHNMMIQALCRIYDLAPVVKQGDEVAFARYASLFVKMVKHHHDMEEDIMFPVLSTLPSHKHSVEHNIEQHRLFDVGFHKFKTYVDEVADGKAKYHGAELRKLVKGFANELLEHFNDEIATIAPEVLAQYDAEHINTMLRDVGRSVAQFNRAGFTTMLPFTLTLLDFSRTPKLEFPPIPAPVVFIGRHVATFRHPS
ncbi:hypothetical protein MNV49_003128 [Pseudohyphozyma bogoriensis]|nr:hypothetical protein MNV49_003128 [Pseudohyphozyma bogoriensis]